MSWEVLDRGLSININAIFHLNISNLEIMSEMLQPQVHCVLS